MFIASRRPASKYTVPKLDLKTAAGCVAALQSPNNETRYLAWTELHKMQGAAESELVKLWKDNDDRASARARFNCSRASRAAKRNTSKRRIKDKDADIRIVGLRTARLLKLNLDDSLVKRLVKDSSPQVRRECAIALRHSNSPDAPKLWAQLAAQT